MNNSDDVVTSSGSAIGSSLNIGGISNVEIVGDDDDDASDASSTISIELSDGIVDGEDNISDTSSTIA